MKVAVLVKPVSDRRPVIDRHSRQVQTPSSYAIGRLDRLALAHALALTGGNREDVTLVIAGAPNVQGFAEHLTLHPVARVVVVTHPVLAGADYYGVARVLAAALERIDADLILAGDRSPDDERGAIPQAVAALLDLPHLSMVDGIESQPAAEDAPRGAVRAVRRADGVIQRARIALPAVVLVSGGPPLPDPVVNGVSRAAAPPPPPPPRDPDATDAFIVLPGAALPADRRVESLDLAELGLSPSDLAGRPAAVSYAPARRPVRRGGAEVLAEVADLVERLRSDRLI